MTHQEFIDRIIEIAESQGFSVNYETTGSTVEFTFSQYTDFGQDFSFEATMKEYNIYTLIEEVNDYYEGYDPDEQAMLWVGPDGHGKNGAPYRLTDVVKDMEQCEQMVNNLLNALIDANNKEILWEQPNF
ncbi:hypothetical protein DWZ36_05670 [Phocaeicola vulgatus]|uniref:hypothetical protein n=1 Tax=Phocaeicola vulgatus TaxID=821 RepID=UPI000E507919|nr:hypothetical protein [Phocaeicola vulgatus]RHM92952.1 hypothetical protein DWZ36_05670 [Phocaeicola vulgatus]